MIEKKSGGFQITIDVDENGIKRATGVKRTLWLDDDGSVNHGATQMEVVTLDKLGDAFPWDDFLPAATKAALLNSEATDQLRADLAAAEALSQKKDEQLQAGRVAAEALVQKKDDEIKQKEAQWGQVLSKAKEIIADREGLIISIRNSVAEVVNTAASALTAADMAIKDRQPPAPAESPADTSSVGL